MANHFGSQEAWIPSDWQRRCEADWDISAPTSLERRGPPQPSSRALFERYGTNEPYVEPEHLAGRSGSASKFELMVGPSTNFYVGPNGLHCTIPKRLLYFHSDYAKVCLESGFVEASANAVWLPDVDPDIFRWLWEWLYTEKLEVRGLYLWDWNLSNGERFEKICRILCRVHFLGERLLFSRKFLEDTVQYQLDEVIEEAERIHEAMPLTPQVIEEILTDSAPVPYANDPSCLSLSLRPFALKHVCNFEFYTEVDFAEYVECFEQDGAFAAEIMMFLATELIWAREQWETQIGQPVNVAEKKKYYASEDGAYSCVAMRPKTSEGVWLAKRYMCTFDGCTNTNFRVYSRCFEFDGDFAAEVLNYMVRELLWIVEAWGDERGYIVDFVREQEEYARVEEEKENLKGTVENIMQQGGWYY